jgi:hypothetical protein
MARTYVQFLVGMPEAKLCISQSQAKIVKVIFSQCRVVYPWANSRSASFITYLLLFPRAMKAQAEYTKLRKLTCA